MNEHRECAFSKVNSMPVVASVLALALMGLVAVVEAASFPIDAWEQTVYYRYSFDAPTAAPATLRITAVDQYEVFFNGTSLGADADWTTMEQYAVELRANDNHLAVRVENRGQGNGSGLVIEVSSGEQTWISDTSALRQVWRWSGEPQSDGSWKTADLSEVEGWAPVQRGQLDRSGISGWADELGAEVIAGFPGGIEVGGAGGGLSLRTVDGENLALGQSSGRQEVFDGDPATAWNIEPDQLNTSARVDLGLRRLLSGVRVFTAGNNSDDFAQNSILGYAVEVSNDGFQWREIEARRDIVDFEQTEVSFTPLFSRYLRVVLIELDPLRRSQIAEIQVLGKGVAPTAAYVSPPLDLGLADQPKNFERFRWRGAVPEGTALGLQFRSSDDGNEWSPWSAEVAKGEAALSVPEPRTLLQYRVNFTTSFEDLAPRLDELVIEFTDEIPVSSARARVFPNRAVVGRDTTFNYALDLDFSAGNLGVKSLSIAMPSLAVVEEIVPPAGVEVAGTAVLGDALEVRFVEPWRQAGTLEVRFRARLLVNQFEFATRLFSPDATAALDAQEDTSPDPDSGAPRSWRVLAFDAEGSVLSAMRAQPPVFTPNGDGLNDDTVIEFTLSRVSLPQSLEVDILDLQGRLVRRLERVLLSGGQYLRPPAGHDAAASPGFWDGRDSSGALVAPGLYLVRLRAKLDLGELAEIRTVSVVY